MSSGRPWKDKVVVVTGGSAGLGRAIGRAFVEAGARVTLIGRDQDRLQQAVDELNGGGQVRCWGVAADVTQEEVAGGAIDRVRREQGAIDVLVNNVGRSARGRLLEVTPAELRDLWECNFLSLVHCTRAAAEALEASRGVVVNLGSLAAKSAARFLGGYAPAKFAVAAYSQQLRLEWAERGVHVLLVCPGPIRREDGGNRYDDQASGLPESARRPGGGVRLRGIDPAALAVKILRACERRQPELVVPGKARWLFAIQQLWPALGDWILRRKTS